ncbi:hypothetical protein HMPREF0291_11075 [Corynebacterium genitalium ATCC 33030]|uniref:Uncharacterized protein n=1 Tax=Corynebacterium genitalium ATCC 33030 TaxID=585529 RepID=D7WC66_9CORY|nr:hypothetical protein HMPREF0291_11075 [Corynebacterium genitalium ATCC 33030]
MDWVLAVSHLCPLFSKMWSETIPPLIVTFIAEFIKRFERQFAVGFLPSTP